MLTFFLCVSSEQKSKMGNSVFQLIKKDMFNYKHHPISGDSIQAYYSLVRSSV